MIIPVKVYNKNVVKSAQLFRLSIIELLSGATPTNTFNCCWIYSDDGKIEIL